MGKRTMDLIVRVTREQLLTLRPCPEGFAYFDAATPSGTYECRDAEQHANALAQLWQTSPDWYVWIAPVFGSGDGAGYSDGYGIGCESGTRYGTAYGIAYGTGYGSGYGSGNGNGIEYGYGARDGSGSGYDYSFGTVYHEEIAYTEVRLRH